MELTAEWWMYLVGYGYSIGFGWIFVSFPIKRLWRMFGGRDEEKKRVEKLEITIALVGCIERIIYTSAYLVSQYGLIAIWLTYKVIGRWKLDEKKLVKAEAYNINIIGTGLSLLYGLTGGLIVDLIRCKQGPYAFLIGLVLVTISISILLIEKIYQILQKTC